MIPELYHHKCKQCKKIQYHKVFAIARAKGTQLVCLLCGTRTRWLKKLEGGAEE